VRLPPEESIEPIVRPALSAPPAQPIDGIGSLEPAPDIIGAASAPAAPGCAPLPACALDAPAAPA
jgi:hypothetical protein